MPVNLKGRSVLKLLDFTPDEVRFLLRLSASLKQAKYGGYEDQRLKGKNIALIFEKLRRAPASRSPPTTRARTSPISVRPAPRSARRNR